MKFYFAILSAVVLLVFGGHFYAQSITTENEEISQREYEIRKERIIKFFEKRRKRYEVVTTTKTKSGQIVDWIKPERQTPDGKLEKAPPRNLPEITKSKDEVENPYLETKLPDRLKEVLGKDEVARTELQLDQSVLGPKGTVPIVRFDLDSYLKANPNYLPKDPMEIFSKVPPPAPASNDRYYAVWQRFGDVYGGIGRINIWNTTGPVGNETSIAQVAIIRGSPMQAIEAGKIEHASFAPSKRPTLFTYFRTNGSARGDWVAGYNALVDGWIQVSRTVAPGMSLVPWESSTNGPQYSLDVEVRLWQGNWWVRAAGEWAGYYPYCKGGDAPPCDEGTLFSAAGIRDKANRSDWYGEVFDSSAPAATSTDMGSGAFANQRWRRAAYFRNILYTWSPTQAWWWGSGSISATDSACYSGDGPYYSSDPNWRNWFYYGGPGKEAAGCF
ncbi:MAG: neprosin family prolyl endopeptidase [Candidatus Caenarcaniphilales bacterium]|nr:neprosin family prolyl endopeptidase [Candidatus Caenarcaniphilales bacterium]